MQSNPVRGQAPCVAMACWRLLRLPFARLRSRGYSLGDRVCQVVLARKEKIEGNAMTPRQRELARHALGLPREYSPRSRTKEPVRSYRNRFVAGPDHADFADWRAMTNAGEANDRGPQRDMRGAHYFTLTPAGARLALIGSERLDREDFPTESL